MTGQRHLKRMGEINPVVLISSFWLVLILVLALAAPVLGLQDPAENNFLALEAPLGAEHLLGTDKLGRDLLSRVIWGPGYRFRLA
jgi:ABC-type dipeptide/oligopeptide/nickel transport system permease subunit